MHFCKPKSLGGGKIEMTYAHNESTTPHKRARLHQVIKTGSDSSGNFSSYVTEYTAKGELVRLVYVGSSRPSSRAGLNELPSYRINSRSEFKESFETLAWELLRNNKAKEIYQSDS